ncbi:1-(5-phosphoribosyl)-5-[(5-phosphoribosylamino)methylideneamino] imidazole-4-carboxamide isomerase [Halomonas sp. BC04]|nr:1-(5-phosphoribosyl)-5-[(5-phosphoribosylamino)methylideneamino] imidazole-4-carboxamide isomerase [Halomonas sp. BC04]
MRGHTPSQAVLQVGKKDVGLQNIEPVGRYAVKLHFDDGHDSGLFSWAYLHDLIENREAYWADYLKRLEKAGASREPLGIEIKQL